MHNHNPRWRNIALDVCYTQPDCLIGVTCPRHDSSSDPKHTMRGSASKVLPGRRERLLQSNATDQLGCRRTWPRMAAARPADTVSALSKNSTSSIDSRVDSRLVGFVIAAGHHSNHDSGSSVSSSYFPFGVKASNCLQPIWPRNS